MTRNSSNATNAAPKSPFAIPSAILGTRMALIINRSRRSLLRLNYRCQGKNVICATFSDAKKSWRQLLIARDGTPGWKTLSISDGNCASVVPGGQFEDRAALLSASTLERSTGIGGTRWTRNLGKDPSTAEQHASRATSYCSVGRSAEALH